MRESGRNGETSGSIVRSARVAQQWTRNVALVCPFVCPLVRSLARWPAVLIMLIQRQAQCFVELVFWLQVKFESDRAKVKENWLEEQINGRAGDEIRLHLFFVSFLFLSSSCCCCSSFLFKTKREKKERRLASENKRRV